MRQLYGRQEGRGAAREAREESSEGRVCAISTRIKKAQKGDGRV